MRCKKIEDTSPIRPQYTARSKESLLSEAGDVTANNAPYDDVYIGAPLLPVVVYLYRSGITADSLSNVHSWSISLLSLRITAANRNYSTPLALVLTSAAHADPCRVRHSAKLPPPRREAGGERPSLHAVADRKPSSDFFSSFSP